MKTFGKIVSGVTLATVLPLSAMALDAQSSEDIASGRMDTEESIVASKPAMEPAKIQTEEANFDTFLAGATKIESPLDRTNVMSTDNQVVGFVSDVYKMPVGPDYALVKTYANGDTVEQKMLVPVEHMTADGKLMMEGNRDEIRQALIPNGDESSDAATDPS
ncbi:hypothetical protein KM176_11340 [Pseudooceanicola sp. CBS1P-1]|uniref:PRC-barrel domain-containing protein n=1 Tax=Pseudooceanicola albus TaxID=2692189 RepID=A0A6L7G9A3_9RHOB|nr:MULTISPECIES: hypothetical protein [Pseudooceanicola]MBT9384454.1 hypothetical protein [Pseudooceanicola endophyticus]MXN20645.1 hypothetical protein [Pseudooceanicola albus]